MAYQAGIDVSLWPSSVCVVEGTGRIVREAKVPSEPEALVRFFGQLGVPVVRIGLEAGPLSPWLHAGLAEAGLQVELRETRQVKAALAAMVVKADRKDARGIAQLLRMGWFRPVHRKPPSAQQVRALLVGRKLLQGKLLDVELSLRGLLRGFGLKVGHVSQGRFAARIRGHPSRRRRVLPAEPPPRAAVGRSRPRPGPRAAAAGARHAAAALMALGDGARDQRPRRRNGSNGQSRSRQGPSRVPGPVHPAAAAAWSARRAARARTRAA